MGSSGHAEGCHAEASAGVGWKEVLARDIDEDSEAGTHLYVKIAFVLHIYSIFMCCL
jgi:hypothetical protein